MPTKSSKQSGAARKGQESDFAAQIAALRKSQALVELTMEGNVITANDNFLNATGYALEEIQGRHHSMFVDDAARQGQAYRDFWSALNRGEFQNGEYRRLGKGGREIWLLASYNPIPNASGKLHKIVAIAANVTTQKQLSADSTSQLAAISKSQAVIEFTMEGTILGANESFLRTLGYTLDEIKGRQHSMFVDETYRQSPDVT